MLNVVILGGGAFGRQLGYECGSLIKGINALEIEIPQSSLAPSITWGYEKCDWEEGTSPTLQAP